MVKFTYLIIDFCTIIIPLIFSFHPKLNFYKNFKAFFISNILVASIFICWDIYFTHLGIWGFNTTYLTGIYLFNLPIEEVLFFICIPFSCVFTYHCLNLFFNFQWERLTEKIVVLTASALLISTGLFFHTKMYTSYTFISLGVILLLLKYCMRVTWLSKLIRVYFVLLIPFFIVNGILTGSGLPAPIVWYNDAENLGMRFFTIPIEDVFYGFELILLNVFFYEYLMHKIPSHSPAN